MKHFKSDRHQALSLIHPSTPLYRMPRPSVQPVIECRPVPVWVRAARAVCQFFSTWRTL